jgi:hypothetical protein
VVAAFAASRAHQPASALIAGGSADNGASNAILGAPLFDAEAALPPRVSCAFPFVLPVPASWADYVE